MDPLENTLKMMDLLTPQNVHTVFQGLKDLKPISREVAEKPPKVLSRTAMFTCRIASGLLHFQGCVAVVSPLVPASPPRSPAQIPGAIEVDSPMQTLTRGHTDSQSQPPRAPHRLSPRVAPDPGP